MILINIITLYIGGIIGSIIAFLGAIIDKKTQRNILNITLWSLVWPMILYKMYFNNTWED